MNQQWGSRSSNRQGSSKPRMRNKKNTFKVEYIKVDDNSATKEQMISPSNNNDLQNINQKRHHYLNLSEISTKSPIAQKHLHGTDNHPRSSADIDDQSDVLSQKTDFTAYSLQQPLQKTLQVPQLSQSNIFPMQSNPLQVMLERLEKENKKNEEYQQDDQVVRRLKTEHSECEEENGAIFANNIPNDDQDNLKLLAAAANYLQTPNDQISSSMNQNAEEQPDHEIQISQDYLVVSNGNPPNGSSGADSQNGLPDAQLYESLIADSRQFPGLTQSVQGQRFSQEQVFNEEQVQDEPQQSQPLLSQAPAPDSAETIVQQQQKIDQQQVEQKKQEEEEEEKKEPDRSKQQSLQQGLRKIFSGLAQIFDTSRTHREKKFNSFADRLREAQSLYQRAEEKAQRDNHEQTIQLLDEALHILHPFYIQNETEENATLCLDLLNRIMEKLMLAHYQSKQHQKALQYADALLGRETPQSDQQKTDILVIKQMSLQHLGRLEEATRVESQIQQLEVKPEKGYESEHEDIPENDNQDEKIVGHQEPQIEQEETLIIAQQQIYSQQKRNFISNLGAILSFLPLFLVTRKYTQSNLKKTMAISLLGSSSLGLSLYWLLGGDRTKRK